METISYSKEVQAIKTHTCDFCNERIIKGQKYMKSTHANDGQIYDWKSHKICAELANKLNMYQDWVEGVTGNYFQECIHEFHDDLMIKLIDEKDINKYSDVIRQLRHVKFHYKLNYVIRHFNKK